MEFNVGVNEFAESFGVQPESFSEGLIKEITELNFNYRKPTDNEFESLILEILKKIDTDTQVIGASEREKVWFDGWNENLEMYRDSDFNEESLTPKFVRPGNPIRLNQSYVFPEDDNFELNFIKIYRLWYLEKYFSDVENIYEFGCGTGFNLLAANSLFPLRVSF